MIALLQRVSQAHVSVGGSVIGAIGPGLLALVCAERGDTARECDQLLDKLIRCRVFADAAGRMNLSLLDMRGGLLIVPQFTLAADTNSGSRPSFTPAAPPDQGRMLFDRFCEQARARYANALSSVATGEFGADMSVSLTNDGPVTLWLQVRPAVC